MAIFRCKMCGGDLEIEQGSTVTVCQYCGSKQTVPSADNEKKMTLFGRANRLLRACEFDKASGIFESIVADFPEEAEAYWGLVLCKYGIEYVDDPSTGEKVPTCHRSSFDSIMDDSDFEQTLENADAVAKRVYREEAKQIEELRKSIIEVSGKEDPYDIFISYKETDDAGERTIDSVLAQDIYDELKSAGYRVFFSRISLEDKLGTEYEPYIFAALNSAKLMIVVGTDYEYFNAVWVKNEWGRYLKIMSQDKSRHLIPCYKSIDAYDMPKEFAKLAAQDLGKVGAMQDLLRGIKKIVPTDDKKEEQSSYTNPTDSAIEPLIKRAFMFLEDMEWDNADAYCEKVLDINPEYALAYLGKMLARLKVKNKEELCYKKRFVDEKEFKKILKYGDNALIDSLKSIAEKSNSASQEIVVDSNTRLMNVNNKTIAAGSYEAFAITNEDTIKATHASFDNSDGMKNYYYNFNFIDWKDMVAISTANTSGSYIVGLKSDGTVVAQGYNKDGQCDVEGWSDIIAIATGGRHTVGLKSNGTVVATGDNSDGQCEVSGLFDVVAIYADILCTYAVKSNGTVKCVGSILKSLKRINITNDHFVDEWKGIVSIAKTSGSFLGVKADGTVLRKQYEESIIDYSKSVINWTDIAEIKATSSYTVGLKKDGTVVIEVAKDANPSAVTSTQALRDIVSISAHSNYYIALDKNGKSHTVKVSNYNTYAGLNADGWTEIKLSNEQALDSIAQIVGIHLKRINEYWEKHQEEKIALESERAALIKQLDELKATNKQKIDQILNSNPKPPYDEELSSLNKTIEECAQKVLSLGLFSKERKAYLAQLNEMKIKKSRLLEENQNYKNSIENKLNSVRNEIRISETALQKKIDAINGELSRDRE